MKQKVQREQLIITCLTLSEKTSGPATITSLIGNPDFTLFHQKVNPLFDLPSRI